MDLDLVRERVWESARRSLLFHTREEFMAELETWDIEPRLVDGLLVGVVMRRGPEIHFDVFSPGFGITRKMMADIVWPQLDEYGYVETRTPVDLHGQHRFNITAGFVEVGRDAFDVHYRMERDSCRLQRYQ